MIEPNCDMPWEIYLDWLQDQGYEDLREIDIGSVSFTNFQTQGFIGILSDNNTITFNCGEGIGSYGCHCGTDFLDESFGCGDFGDGDFIEELFNIGIEFRGTEFFLMPTGAG